MTCTEGPEYGTSCMAAKLCKFKFHIWHIFCLKIAHFWGFFKHNLHNELKMGQKIHFDRKINIFRKFFEWRVPEGDPE